MSEGRKHVGILRTLGALILAGLLGGLLLVGFNLFYSSVMEGNAFSTSFYVLAGIVALVLFFLLLFPANRPLRGFKTFLRWLLIAVLGLGLFAAGAVWLVQNEQLYHPAPYKAEDLARVEALPQLEAVSVQGTAGRTYKGWTWRNAGQDPAGLVLYFGGNGEFAAQVMPRLAGSAQAAQLFQGYDVMMVDYPGYGGSQGAPDEDSIRDMADAAMDYALARQETGGRVVLMGWSLGSASAARLAAERQPKGLMLLAPFLNGAELLNDYIGAPLFDGNGRLLVRNRFENDVYAQQTTCPVLVIGAREDRLIPVHQAESLAALYPEHQLVLVDGDHGAVHSEPAAVAAIQGFLQEMKGR